MEMPVCRRMLAVRALDLVSDFLLFALHLGQLLRRAGELLGHGGKAVFQQLALLLRLGQQAFGLLVAAVQRRRMPLHQFVLVLQGDCCFWYCDKRP